MDDLPISDKFRLQFNEDLLECDVCGADVESFNEGKGQYLLCPEHDNWRGWFRAWRLDRRG